MTTHRNGTLHRHKTLTRPERRVREGPLLSSTREAGFASPFAPVLSTVNPEAINYPYPQQSAQIRNGTLAGNIGIIPYQIQPVDRSESLKIEPPKVTSARRNWVAFCTVVTLFVPSFVLKWFGIPPGAQQQAWREKVALCFLIACVCALVGFFTLGLQRTLCPPSMRNDRALKFNTPGTANVYGRLYNLSHPQNQRLANLVERVGSDGNSISLNQFISPDVIPHQEKCSNLGSRVANFNPCQSSDCLSLRDLVPINSEARREALYAEFGWNDVYNRSDIFVINGVVLDFSSYLRANPAPSANDSIDAAIRRFTVDSKRQPESVFRVPPKDGTKSFKDKSDLDSAIPCLLLKFQAGVVDKDTVGCFIANVVMVASLVIILGVVLVRFVMALIFEWTISPTLASHPSKSKMQALTLPNSLQATFNSYPPKTNHNDMKHRVDGDSIALSRLSFSKKDDASADTAVQTYPLPTIMLVTCYSEDLAGLKTTFDSLAQTTYPDGQKLLFIVADGVVTGSGNAKATGDLCLDLIELDPRFGEPEPVEYVAVGEKEKRINRAKVYVGHYVHNANKVPAIVVYKCGTEKETGKPKAGNRGKRDSQILLMNFLSKILYNERMAPLEYDLSWKLHRLMGFPPTFFEFVLMVDADTFVLPDAISLLTNACINDPLVMGLCGETRIANKRTSFTTMIQVFEYYISHHLGKSFESVFGGVTCLPGCFCMYRIWARKGDTVLPILANRDILGEYSQPVVTTLHEKNLLLLGEDRFLTTLMLRTFPKRKMIFVPKAICKTFVPDDFKVLLSQRRRWINSTIHNLMELVKIRDLCGVFCCSMQFVVALELLGTASLPIAIVLTYYLLFSLPATIASASATTVATFVPLILLLAILFLPAILILFTTRKWIYVGWMMIYLLVLPIWNFVIPVYSFWKFDDFSWGMTRQIDGPDVGHGHETEGKKHCLPSFYILSN
ncbi:chitin synthase-domain-containing protein [Paraphysoderma sedebokerense]|nr:chitin synthase-domain-containing protein [Paraphysoderma sedebokerense]